MVSRSTVLVTGAAGFLGSHLTERLLDDGHDVVGVDNLFTGSKKNIQHLSNHPRFEFLRHDVTFPLYLEVGLIFNLACPASPYWYQQDPVQTLKTSVLGAINMLGLAKRTGATIVQASTSEVYGDPAVSPQVETYWGNVNPIGPRSCYDEGKRAAETLFTDYRRQHGVDARIARIFNTYGPRMAENDGRVMSNFIVQALSDAPLTVYGDGSQTRSFCYVDDLVEGLVRLGTTKRRVGAPINLGNTHEVSILEIAQLVIQLSGSASGIEYMPLPTDDPVRRRPDTSRAHDILDWAATTVLEEGLVSTIRYFQLALSDDARKA
jgi:UDP-glucuronate decarboxylase